MSASACLQSRERDLTKQLPSQLSSSARSSDGALNWELPYVSLSSPPPKCYCGMAKYCSLFSLCYAPEARSCA